MTMVKFGMNFLDDDDSEEDLDDSDIDRT